jgi:hypothetical protein
MIYRVYGLQTGGTGGLWKLDLMVASPRAEWGQPLEDEIDAERFVSYLVAVIEVMLIVALFY